MTFKRLSLIGILSFALVFAVEFFVFSEKTTATGVSTHYWIEDVSGNWSDGSNWSIIGPDGATCVVAADCVPDEDSPTYFDSSSNGDVVIDADITASSIYFESSYAGDFNNSGNHDVTVAFFYFAGSGTFTKGTGAYLIDNTTTHYWIEGVSGNWSDGTNWSVLGPTASSCGCYPDESDETAQFYSTGSGDIILDVDIVGISGMYFDSSYPGDFDNSGDNDINIGTDSIQWTSAGTLTFGDGFITVSGSGPATFYNGSVIFGSGTYNFEETLDISGATVNFGSGTFNLEKDFQNEGGVLNAGTSTVNMSCAFDVLFCGIFGTNTFNNLNIVVGSAKTFLFTENTVTTINGSLTLQGASANALLSLGVYDGGVLSTDGSRAVFSVNGVATVNNIEVRDLDNLGTTQPVTDFIEASESSRLSTRGWFERGPGGVTENLELWLRADAFVYEAAANLAEHNDSVLEWKDSTINMTTVSQVIAARKPLYKTGSGVTAYTISTAVVPTQTNYSSNLYFDGGDSLESLSGFYTDAFFISGRPSSQPIRYQSSTFSPLGFNVTSLYAQPNGGVLIGDDNVAFTAIMSYVLNTRTINASSYFSALNFFQDQHNYYPETFVFHSQKGSPATSAFHQIFMNDYEPSADESPDPDPNYHQEADVRFIVGSYFNESLAPQYNFTGPLTEVISFSDRLSDTDKTKVASYLAIKNGVTLVQKDGVGLDYLASDGTEIWDKDFLDASTYDNDIVVLGRDDSSGLLVEMAQSMNTIHVDNMNETDDILFVNSPSDLDDLEFIAFANNIDFKDSNDSSTPGSSSYSDLVGGYDDWVETDAPDGYARTTREWQVQEVGDLGTINMQINETALITLKSLPFYSPLYLLVDDDPDLSDATAVELTDQGTYWDITRDFSDGEYFALAFRQIDIEFNHDSYSSQESDGSGVPNIIYTGEAVFAINGLVSTSDSQTGSATDAVDYDSYISETFNISVGEYDNYLITLSLSINDDSIVEPDESIVMTITAPSPYFNIADVNGDGQSVSSATYIIEDDDGSSNGGCVGSCGNTDNDIEGCMDPDANNYNPSATVSIGCLYTEIAGCTLIGYDNFNPQATINDGSCENDGEDPDPVCTDPSCNPPPEDDDSGCTDQFADNYDSSALTDDGSCEYPTEGCTDSLAINFDSDADLNDGSCDYPDPTCVGTDCGTSVGSGDDEGGPSGGGTGCDGVIGRIECGGGNVAFIPFLMLLASMVQTLSQYLLNSQTTFSQWIISLFTGKKKRPWGVVFDSFTKEPLDPVYVVLKDASTNQMVQTSITDLDGRYGFLVAKGVYRIEASKMSYQFPSLRLAGKTKDELYDNLYFGGDITIEEDDQVMTHNIPMDPLEENWNEKEKLKRGLTRYYSRFDKFFAVLSEVIFTLGFLFSIFATIVSPIIWNIVVLALYVGVLLFKQFGFDRRGKPGRVTIANEPLVHGVIRLISPETGVEVKKTVTSKDGYYYCLAPKGEYDMEVCSKQPDGTYIPVLKKRVFVKRGVLREVINI